MYSGNKKAAIYSVLFFFIQMQKGEIKKQRSTMKQTQKWLNMCLIEK